VTDFPDPAGCTLFKGIKGPLAKPVRISFTRPRKLDDFARNQFGYRVLSITELKHFQHIL
jgi:hypothetical protein